MEKIYYKTFDDKEMHIDLYLPQNKNKKPKLAIFFYGGSWSGGKTDQFKSFAQELSRLGLAVALPDYRVSSRQNSTIDISIKDAIYSIEHLCNIADEYRIDTSEITVGGGSAGGHLALSSLLLEEFIPTNFCYNKKISTLLLCNPVVDVVDFSKTSKSKALTECKIDMQKASPYHNIKNTSAQIHIFHGKSDSTVPFYTVEKFTEKYKEVGGNCTLYPYENQTHGFFNLRETSIVEFYSVLGHMVDVLNKKGWLEIEFFI